MVTYRFWRACSGLTRQPSSLPQGISFLSTLTLNIARLFPWFNNDQTYSHLWSLGVEMQFYLLWPLLIYFMRRERLPLLILLFLSDRSGSPIAHRLANLTSAFLIGILNTKDLPFFRDAVAQRLGRISYGLYLFHLPVQALMKFPISGKSGIDPESTALFALSIIGTILLALASYELFEVHFLRLKNLYQPPVRTEG